jgi:hypothetical protein
MDEENVKVSKPGSERYMWKIDSEDKHTNTNVILYMYIYTHIYIYIYNMFVIVELCEGLGGGDRAKENDNIEIYCICVGRWHNKMH